MTIELGDLAAQPAGDYAAVELGFDRHPAAGQVQSSRETQQRCKLRPAAARLACRQPAQLVLDRAGQPSHHHQLPTGGYDPAALAGQFTPTFALEYSETEQHITPTGDVQPFTWVVLRRQR